MAQDFQVEDDPYDPSTTDHDQPTLPLDEIIRRAISAAMLRFNVCRPAKITQVLGNQKVSAQIQTKALYIGGDPFLIPVIQNVLYWSRNGANGYDLDPPAVGDTGLLFFADRSLDIWSNGDGSAVDPNDSRTHDLNDAIFFPGVVPFSKQIVDTSGDSVRSNGNGKAQLRLTQGGKVLLGTKDSANPAVLGDILITAMDALIGQINAIVTALQTVPLVSVTGSPGGASPINPAITALLGDVTAQLSSIQSQYFDTASTNIASQQTFLRRGP